MYLASTQALINLWETGIISEQALDEVYQQTRHLEDNEDIAEGIETWLESQNDSQLQQAYQDKLKQFTSSISLESGETIGAGGSKSQTKSGEPNPTSRELLDNIITKNQPLIDDASAQSKPNS